MEGGQKAALRVFSAAGTALTVSKVTKLADTEKNCYQNVYRSCKIFRYAGGILIVVLKREKRTRKEQHGKKRTNDTAPVPRDDLGPPGRPAFSGGGGNFAGQCRRAADLGGNHRARYPAWRCGAGWLPHHSAGRPGDGDADTGGGGLQPGLRASGGDAPGPAGRLCSH